MLNQPPTIWIGCSGGHLLRPVFSPPQRAASDWVDEALVSEVRQAAAGAPPALREAAAQAWEQAALELHHGLLDGSRLTLELMAVGAPSDLLDACEAGCASLTELTSQAFSLASGYAGALLAPRGVTSTAALRVSPSELAEACFLEGICGGGLLLQALELQRQSALERWVAELNLALTSAASARQQLARRVVGWLITSAGNDDLSPLDAALPARDYDLLPVRSCAADPWLDAQGLLSAAQLQQLGADFLVTELVALRRALPAAPAR